MDPYLQDSAGSGGRRSPSDIVRHKMSSGVEGVRKLRILSVTSLWPYPPDDGTRTRSWNLISRIARTEDVTLLTWIDETVDPADFPPVEHAVGRVIRLSRKPVDLSAAAKLRRRIAAQRRKIPSYVIERMERQPVPEPGALGGPYDVVVAEDDSAFYLLPTLTAPVVVNRHNIFSDTIETLIRSGNLSVLRRLKLRMEREIWRSYDRSLSASADLNVVTTPEAKERLLQMLPTARIEVVRNGVELPPEAHDPAQGDRVVFIGGMGYEPNVDAVVWFAEKVWPQVIDQVPGASFDVIGREPHPRLSQLSATGITIVGEVEDMVAACREARVGVVPLRAGSGIKNKTLELMAMGLPVVATTQGVEGFEGRFEGCSVTEDPAEMASLVTALLKDPERARREGALARKTARTFSWEEAAETLRRALHSLVDQPGAGRVDRGSSRR